MIKPTKKFQKFKLENAQTMLEFALVFPIVLLITFGLIEFGRMLFIFAAVTGSAREGSRYGAAGGNFNTRYYTDCTGIIDAVKRGAILIPINTSNISIWYDHGPNTNHIRNFCPPMDANSADPIDMGDRIGVHVIAHYTPIIAFLGLRGFDIVAENARTILVNVAVVGTALPPVSTNTPAGTPRPTRTSTPIPPPTDTPTETQIGQPTQIPITPTPACIVSGGRFDFISNPTYFRWTITSQSTDLIRLNSASVFWPTPIVSPTPTNPPYPTATPTPVPSVNLRGIDVNVNSVWVGNISPPGASVFSWIGDESIRELAPGTSHTLSFKYSLVIPSGDYSVTLNYIDVPTGLTCSVSYTDSKP
jgi:hypothetical protein